MIFQSSFNCCSLPECLYPKISASNASHCGAERKRIVRQIDSEVRHREIASNSARINKYRAENAEFRYTERAATAFREKSVVWKIQNSAAMNKQLRLSEKNRRVENPDFRRNERAADAVRKTTRRVENREFRHNERASTAVREKKCRVENLEFRRNERTATAEREKKTLCGKSRIQMQ